MDVECKSEIRNPQFRLFLGQVTLLLCLFLVTVLLINYFVDASQVITTKSSKDMAKLALSGKIIAVPKNYNGRAFQVSIIEQMKDIPETIVIGSSRGMYLGKDITGYDSIYNHCVPGGSMEDYYALLGLYEKKFSKLPHRIIIEVSPWVFYNHNPDSRWSENITYRSACMDFYKKVNGKSFIRTNLKKENPYLSIPYFQYNLEAIKENGAKAFTTQPARESCNTLEQADYPDGTIRYVASLERPNPKRLDKVKSTNRGVTYQNVHKMKKIGTNQKREFERLINYLLKKNIEIIFYLQPFSLTQCKFIYEKNTNPVFGKIEKYLTDFSTQCNVTNIGKRNNIKVIGSYNAKYYNLSDESFIDFMHLDKAGTASVWKSFRKKRLSIGDSFAYGMTSNLKGTRNKRGTSWTRYLADAVGYNLISQEVRGMGYCRTGPNQISFEQTLRKVESMTGDCNLVTVALGINDYIEEGVSLADLQVVIDDSVQRLIKKFPNARLVYITPFNSGFYGNQLTNYDKGYEFSGRTLNNIADLIKQRCGVYGVHCINCTENFLTNSEVEQLLPDKVHPSGKGHIFIAKKIYRRRLKQFL